MVNVLCQYAEMAQLVWLLTELRADQGVSELGSKSSCSGCELGTNAS
jgi:hypothetical protein